MVIVFHAVMMVAAIDFAIYYVKSCSKTRGFFAGSNVGEYFTGAILVSLIVADSLSASEIDIFYPMLLFWVPLIIVSIHVLWLDYLGWLEGAAMFLTQNHWLTLGLTSLAGVPIFGLIALSYGSPYEVIVSIFWFLLLASTTFSYIRHQAVMPPRPVGVLNEIR